MRTIEVVIHGLVQGVFFRKYTQEKGSELGLTGFVMNQLDGTVKAVACGEEKALDAFVKWCDTGSPQSKVDRVIIREIKEELVLPENFEIRH